MEIENIECILSLGSNIGNKTKNLENALLSLQEFSEKPIEKSTFIETEPWGFDSENTFLNCCVKIATLLSPFELLVKLQEIEKNGGRTSKSENSMYQDRLIDIDIVFYGSEILKSDNLQLPHPNYSKRKFVLESLIELCPNWIDPETKMSILQYYTNITSN
jgi:2-amino-4-hydroxy-6-hydroxymethyldihydropteridine diphosphokinase